jgi:hypothetical protein
MLSTRLMPIIGSAPHPTVKPKDAKKRFHEIKSGNRGRPGSKANDACGVNPDTGEIIDGTGEHIGDLNDGH